MAKNVKECSARRTDSKKLFGIVSRGRDVARLLTEDSRALVERVLSEETNASGAGALVTAMVKNNSNYHGDFDVAQSRLADTYLGITERLGS